MRTVRYLVCLVAVLSFSAVASQVRAEPPAVVTVVTSRVKGDGSAFLKKLRAGKPILLRLGAKNIRYYREAFGGGGTSMIVSVAEYENAEAFGKARVKRADDEEFKKWLADLQNSNLSEDVHAEMLEEIQP